MKTVFALLTFVLAQSAWPSAESVLSYNHNLARQEVIRLERICNVPRTIFPNQVAPVVSMRPMFDLQDVERLHERIYELKNMNCAPNASTRQLRMVGLSKTDVFRVLNEYEQLGYATDVAEFNGSTCGDVIDAKVLRNSDSNTQFCVFAAPI